MTTECDSAKARYHEVLSALRHVVKARKDKEDEPVDTFVKIRELLDQGRNVALLTPTAELANLRTKVTSLTNNLEVKEPEIQSFSGSMDETARLREELKKMRTNALDLSVPLDSLEVLWTQSASIRVQVVCLSSAAGARRRNEPVYEDLRQKITDLGLFTERKARLKRLLNALEAKL